MTANILEICIYLKYWMDVEDKNQAEHLASRFKSFQMMNEDAKNNCNLFMFYFLYLTHKNLGINIKNKLSGLYKTF